MTEKQDLEAKLELPENVSQVATLHEILLMWPMAKDWDTFSAWYLQGNLLGFQIGERAGVYLLYNVVPGHKATCSVNILNKEYLGKKARPLHQEWCDWAIRTFGLKRLEAHIDVGNRLAIQLVRDIGFDVEGVLRNYGFGPDGPNNVWVGSIVRD